MAPTVDLLPSVITVKRQCINTPVGVWKRITPVATSHASVTTLKRQIVFIYYADLDL